MKQSNAVAVHLERVTGGLDSLLVPLGFKASEKIRRVGKYRMRLWRRDSGWKAEVVQFSQRLGTGIFIISFDIYIPDSEQGGERIFDGREVSDLAGRSGPYRAPSVFGRTVKFSLERFEKRICGDTEEALEWFNWFETPAKCLARLETGQTNGGGARGGKAYTWFESYFKRRLEETV